MPRLVGTRVETPVGPLLAIASDVGLCGLPFLPRERRAPLAGRGHRLDAWLRRWFGVTAVDEGADDPVIRQTRAWLAAYFAGESGGLTLPPLDMRGAEFQRRVWTALLDIPIGTTTSYGAIARRLGNADASRAVGLANGANPVPIIVPCHRVIGASGALTGYGGGLDRKTWLLAHERRHWGREMTLDF